MKVTDEMMACYVEGTCTPEELQAVRRHLVANPRELDRIVGMADDYRHLKMRRHSAPRMAMAALMPCMASPVQRSHTPAPAASACENLSRLMSEIDSLI